MAEVAGAPAAALVPQPRRVRRRLRETADVFTLELEAGEDAAGFRPGQFNMLYVFGTGEVPMSMSGDPRRLGALVHTTRAVGPVTQAMAALRAGAALGVRGPFGTPWPVETAVGTDVLLVAGGIGLAPLRPLVYEILARRPEFGRVVVLYGTRSPAELLFRRDLARWPRAGIGVEITVDHATREWPGHVGVVTTLVGGLIADPACTTAFVCGPELMMRFAADALARAGVPEARVFLSMERNMKCAVGFCGHCQFGAAFVCKDGPVFPWPRVRDLLAIREV